MSLVPFNRLLFARALFTWSRVITLPGSHDDISQFFTRFGVQRQTDAMVFSIDLFPLRSEAQGVSRSQMVNQQRKPCIDFSLRGFDDLSAGLIGERVDGHLAAVDVVAGTVPTEDLFRLRDRPFYDQPTNHASGFDDLIGDFFF